MKLIDQSALVGVNVCVPWKTSQNLTLSGSLTRKKCITGGRVEHVAGGPVKHVAIGPVEHVAGGPVEHVAGGRDYEGGLSPSHSGEESRQQYPGT